MLILPLRFKEGDYMFAKKKAGSVSVKLRFVIVIFFLLLILSVFFILRVHYSDLVIKKATMQLQYEDEILSQSIEERIKTANSGCNTIIIHLNNTLKEQNGDGEYPSVNTATQKKIYQCMINTFTMFYDAAQVMIVWDNGTCFYQNRTENYFMYTGESELLEELASLGITRTGSWLTRINSDCKIQGEGQYFIKVYADIDSGKKLGYIIFKLNNVFDILDEKSSHRSFYLFDRDRQLLQTNDITIQEELLSYYDNQDRLTMSQQLSSQLSEKDPSTQYTDYVTLENGWTLVSVSDFREMLKDLHRTIAFILMICLVIMTVLCTILNTIVQHIIKPIRTLSRHMVSFQSELLSPISIPHSDDEIGILVDHFNEMAQKNKELFEHVLEEKRQQEHLQFALLQSQIKPHFLYNTLDTIYCLIAMKRQSEASYVTKLLSEYYRRVLSKGLDWVLLNDEVAEVEKYLEIQSIRYRNVLSYSIEFEAGVDLIKIPKLTLQPLVENAIYHGIKSSDHPGHVTIRITQEGDYIEIRVMDDGVGFSEEQFREIINQPRDADSGFGLRNVIDRLRLYYKDSCEVLLEKRNVGTSVLLRIHVEPEEV